MTKVNIIIISLIILFGCSNSREEIFLAVERFDNSLDSLIVERSVNFSSYCVLIGDTLKNSPKRIEQTNYQLIDGDSLLIDANCHNYQFENNELTIDSSQDPSGNKYAKKYIYFNDKIDNWLIETLRKRHQDTDTVIIGRLKKYDSKGRTIKRVTSGEWREINENTRQLTVNDYRMLEVYRYDPEGKFYTTFRKEYFNKKYNIDSLSIVAVSDFNRDLNKDNSSGHFQYSYSYDKFGNWIIKRRINNKYPEVYYRKIYY